MKIIKITKLPASETSLLARDSNLNSKAADW